MDRRQVLAGGSLLALPRLVWPRSAFASTEAPTTENAQRAVWNLKPGSSLPESYRSAMTEAEEQKIIRDCAQPHGPKCFPILEGEQQFTNRFFRTYSFFLIANPGWLGPDGAAKLKALYAAYEGFSRAIGAEHAAVFFWKKPPPMKDGYLAGADPAALIDASRCAKYEKAFGLSADTSPQVVVTTSKPDLSHGGTPPIIIRMADLSPAATEALLTKLAAQLILNKIDANDIASAQYWLSWKEALQSTLTALGHLAKYVKITIKGGPVEAEIGGGNKD